MKNYHVASQVTAEFNSSLECAFKTVLLGDAMHYINVCSILPPVVGFTHHLTWGKEGGTRIPLTSGNFFVKKGELCDDIILKRVENTYWKWRIYNFRTKALFFATKAEGEFFFEENTNGAISIKWMYTFYSKNKFTLPLTFLFTKLVWHRFQKKVIQKMKMMAEAGLPYAYTT